ncbi:MAG: hypothetical protein ACOYL3_25370 [Desulfuromonadaceae bacterium]
MQFYIDPYFPDSITAVGDAGMAGFDEKRPLYLSGSKNFLAKYREVQQSCFGKRSYKMVILHFPHPLYAVANYPLLI